MVCPSWFSFILYNPIRKLFTDREKILTDSGISKESIVLEVGAGNGFLTEMLAKHAKKIYAIELQEGMIRKLRKRIAGFGQNVTVIRGDIASIVLEEEFVDVCMLYYSFHEFSEQEKAAENISKTVKPGGIVSIYEPTIEVGKYTMLHTVSLFEQRGFVKLREETRMLTRFVSLRKSPQ